MSLFSGTTFSGPYITSETGVFWDIDECEIPEELHAAQVLQRIKQNFSDRGHCGPVSLRAYGDMTGLDFQSSEIKLNHFHAGEKREKLTRILEDIVEWSDENPEPSTVVLILGDLGDVGAYIAEAIRLLKIQKNYEFVLVYPPPRTTVFMILRSIPRGGL